MLFLAKSTVRRLTVVNLIFLSMKKEVNYCWPVYCCDLANNNIDIVTPNVVLKFIFWGSRNTLCVYRVILRGELPKINSLRVWCTFSHNQSEPGCCDTGLCMTWRTFTYCPIEYFDFPKNLFIQGLYYCTTNSDPCTINTNLWWINKKTLDE